jgi:hypothetical protein
MSNPDRAVALHDLFGLARVVEVFLVGPEPVTRVLEDGDAPEAEDLATARGVGKDLPRVEDHPVALDHAPLDGELHRRRLGHDGDDALSDRLAPPEGPEVVLHPESVLGVQFGPGIPIAGVPCGDEALELGFDLATGKDGDRAPLESTSHDGTRWHRESRSARAPPLAPAFENWTGATS